MTTKGAKETNTVLPNGVDLKELVFDDTCSRLIWKHIFCKSDNKMNINIAASYVANVLSRLELSFWMSLKEEGEPRPVPYNITYFYAGAAEELESVSVDLGRFNHAKAGAVIVLSPPDTYRILHATPDGYPIRFPGKDGEMEVVVPRICRPRCEWKFDDLRGCHDTACGSSYVFDVDFKTGKAHKFCPGCGKSILLMPTIEDSNDD